MLRLPITLAALIASALVGCKETATPPEPERTGGAGVENAAGAGDVDVGGGGRATSGSGGASGTVNQGGEGGRQPMPGGGGCTFVARGDAESGVSEDTLLGCSQTDANTLIILTSLQASRVAFRFNTSEPMRAGDEYDETSPMTSMDFSYHGLGDNAGYERSDPDWYVRTDNDKDGLYAVGAFQLTILSVDPHGNDPIDVHGTLHVEATGDSIEGNPGAGIVTVDGSF